ncbi:hypothetical protein KIPB_009386 [Kipferlia bialata]|uniref:Glycoside hydrolase family 5 domain-containing protein n=1 Tax=Kipferlia bialata TaxID=797122 RepID=A0A9K3D273_9EUKA|nr:hypothetical protein KIPB_009386 [Kipferlia bialata]|eukprot:g9386.t1
MRGGSTLLCVLLLVSCVLGYIRVDPVTQRFYDEEDGAQIYMHGVNAVYKAHPYIPSINGFDPETTLSQTDVDLMVEWGFNVVRLGRYQYCLRVL